MKKIQRNEQCPCGSGLKFKLCHGKTLASTNGNNALSPSIQIPDVKDSNSGIKIDEEQHYQNALKLCNQVEEIRSTQPNHILNSFRIGIFNEFGLIDPEIIRIKKIAAQLRDGVQYVNGGGCGLFALLLQSLVGGEIYHICLAFKLNGEYPFYGDHDFLIHNGICYDSDGACKETTLLMYKQPMRRVASNAALRGTKPTTTYCLYKVTNEEILENYKNGEYLNKHCSNEDKLRMVQNAKRLAEKMKNATISPEIEQLFNANTAEVTLTTKSFFQLNFIETVIQKISEIFPSKNAEIEKALENSNFPILNHFYEKLKQMSPNLLEFRFSNAKVNEEYDDDCWNNAMKVTRKYGYRYCEGLLITNTYGFKLHAWNLDHDGNIIDISTNNSTLYKSYNQYFGVVFKSADALRKYGKVTQHSDDLSLFSGLILPYEKIREILNTMVYASNNANF